MRLKESSLYLLYITVAQTTFVDGSSEVYREILK